MVSRNPDTSGQPVPTPSWLILRQRYRQRLADARASDASPAELDDTYVAGGVARRHDPEVIRLRRALRRQERAADDTEGQTRGLDVGQDGAGLQHRDDDTFNGPATKTGTTEPGPDPT